MSENDSTTPEQGVCKYDLAGDVIMAALMQVLSPPIAVTAANVLLDALTGEGIIAPCGGTERHLELGDMLLRTAALSDKYQLVHDVGDTSPPAAFTDRDQADLDSLGSTDV